MTRLFFGGPLAAVSLALLSLAGSAGASQFSLDNHLGGHLHVLLDGKIIARYMDAHDNSTKERRLETYKPQPKADMKKPAKAAKADAN